MYLSPFVVVFSCTNEAASELELDTVIMGLFPLMGDVPTVT
jgi:hypothetical protein